MDERRYLYPTVGLALLLILALLSIGHLGAEAATTGKNPTAPDRLSPQPAAALSLARAAALGTAFTYQGYLEDGGAPADGSYDFQFKLYHAASAGNPVGSTVARENVAVANGTFAVALDFGIPLTGADLWLEIGVRPGSSSGADSYTLLDPRQPLTPAPYALYAAGAAWSGLTNVPTGLDDGDDDTLGGLSCADGQIPKLDAGAGEWRCGNDDVVAGGDLELVASDPNQAAQLVLRGTGDQDNYALMSFEKSDAIAKWHLAFKSGNPSLMDGYFAIYQQLQNGTWHPRLIFADSGNVGIGVEDPQAKLHVAGDILADNFPTPSDARLKTNVEPLTNVLDKLDQVHGVSFQWNAVYDSPRRTTEDRDIGVIAQEVEEVFPELITVWGEEGYRAIDYGRLTAVLVEAIKELRADQETEIAVLEARVAALEALVNQLAQEQTGIQDPRSCSEWWQTYLEHTGSCPPGP